MIRIFVEEEYGFNDCIWVFPGTEQDLADWWEKNMKPEIAFCSIGGLEQIVEEQCLGYICPVLALPENNYEFIPEEGTIPYIHVHMEDDSYLILPSDIEPPKIVLEDNIGPGMIITRIDDCFCEYSDQFLLIGTDAEVAWRKFITKKSCMPKSAMLYPTQ